MPPLKDQIKKAHAQVMKKRNAGPVWTGPCGEGPQGGITFSLLSRFLVDRERFRLLVVEGLKPAPAFNPVMDFGTLWHICEEGLAAKKPWVELLENHGRELCKRFPFQAETILHWYSICKALFPVYVEHWSRHPDVKKRIPLFQERRFDLQYKLPSGRMVRLRGKFDSGDLIDDAIYLQENKSKSTIDKTKIERQLKFDLQTMLYLIALRELKDHSFWNRSNKSWRDKPIAGVRYNVIRRSAHKSTESMLKKVKEDGEAGRIEEWFARWNSEVSTADIAIFQRECLDPILEQLCDWWEWILLTQCFPNNSSPFNRGPGSPTGTLLGKAGGGIHWRHPFGVYNVLNEGGAGEVDEYMATKSEVGLRRADDLFEELNNGEDKAVS